VSARRQPGIRWTIGDVSPRGWEALRLSVWGALGVFGPEAAYAVCVNSVPLDQARARAGELPEQVEWMDASHALPALLARHLDEGLAEGVGWKFAPLRYFADRAEISLDNDCILWEMPEAVRDWLADQDPLRCLMAEDVKALYGQFTDLCEPEPRNSGIRGLPARFDLEGALAELLRERPVTLRSELDEQGLQMAALSRARPLRVVSVDEVTICSPFPPHLPYLGSCGAHFVGLNARSFPWELDGRPAEEHIRENWEAHRPELYARVGLPLEA
jgi:hypothetical protein